MRPIPAACLILFLLEPALALAAAWPIGLVIGAISLRRKPLGNAHVDFRRRRARLASALAEGLPQRIALRRSGLMKKELRALDGQSREILRATVRPAGRGPEAGARCCGLTFLGTVRELDLAPWHKS